MVDSELAYWQPYQLKAHWGYCANRSRTHSKWTALRELTLTWCHLIPSVAAACFTNRAAEQSWSVGSENYCYTKGSCYGDKIPALSGELLMTKSHCCDSLSGASWGSLYVSQCESCFEQTPTDLPLHASSKCIVHSRHICRHYALSLQLSSRL